MYNDTIKLLNLEQFILKIEKLDTAKINNVLYCYITLKNQGDNCPFCNHSPIKKNILVKKSLTPSPQTILVLLSIELEDSIAKLVHALTMKEIFLLLKTINFLLILFSLFLSL